MAGSVGELNLLLTANAGPMLAAVKLATTACKNYESAASSSMANAAKKAEEYAAKSVQALTRLGKGPLVSGPGTLSDALRRQAEAAAAVIRSRYPALAAEMERQKRALVKVTESGDMLVAARDARGKIGYRTVGGLANDPAAIKAMEKAEKSAKSMEEWRKWGKDKAKMAAVAAPAVAVGGFAYGVSSLLAQDREARKLGVTLTELRQLQFAAGDASGAMATAVGELTTKMAMLRRGDLDTQKLFRGLGVGGDGTGTAVESFAQIAERLRGIADPAARATAAFRVFGSAYSDLMPLIMKGGAGVSDAAGLAGRLGLNVGERDMEGIRKVGETITTIKGMAAGLFNQAVLGVAPFVNALTGALATVRVDFSGLKDVIVSVAEAIATAGAMVVAVWGNPSMIRPAWKAMAAGVKALSLLMAADVVDAFKRAITGSLGMVRPILAAASIGMPKPLRDLINGGIGGNDGLRKDAGKAAEEAMKAAGKFKVDFDASDPGAWVKKTFATIRALMGGKEKIAVELVGPPEADIAALVQRFNGMRDAVRPVTELFSGAMSDIDEMRRRDLFKGDPGLEARMRVKAFRDLGAAMPAVQFAGAATMGSREEYSALAAFRSENRKTTVEDVIRAVAAQQLAEQEKANELSTTIRDVLLRMADEEGEDI